jgi:hypothetical protein
MTLDSPPATPGPPLSEAILSRLWAGQRFPESALVTNDGVPLRVLHPGIAGRGAGPDFREAIIAAQGRLLRGDVELHQRSSDFRTHGHHRDPRYGNLVLHVVFVDDDPRVPAPRVPVVALAPWLDRRTRELSGWLASPSLWREPCHDAVARLGDARVGEVLATLGEQRFEERAAFFRDALDGSEPGAVLYRALLTGLGYGGDRPLVERVADLLPWSTLSAAITSSNEHERLRVAEALLLKAAEHQQLPPGAGSVRPANHPARRLAGLAALIVRHERLFTDRALLHREIELSAGQLVASWTVPASGRWREQFAPGVPARRPQGARPQGALIGRGRAIELLVNGVLPCAAALGASAGDEALAAAARDAFARLPSPGHYGRLAFLEANLGLGAKGRRLDARAQQGLLALYKSECTQGGCGRCELSRGQGTLAMGPGPSALDPGP